MLKAIFLSVALLAVFVPVCAQNGRNLEDYDTFIGTSKASAALGHFIASSKVEHFQSTIRIRLTTEGREVNEKVDISFKVVSTAPDIVLDATLTGSDNAVSSGAFPSNLRLEFAAHRIRVMPNTPIKNAPNGERPIDNTIVALMIFSLTAETITWDTFGAPKLLEETNNAIGGISTSTGIYVLPGIFTIEANRCRFKSIEESSLASKGPELAKGWHTEVGTSPKVFSMEAQKEVGSIYSRIALTQVVTEAMRKKDFKSQNIYIEISTDIQ